MIKKLILVAIAALSVTACVPGSSDQAAQRQAVETRQNMDRADRETGMPRITNYAQRKLLKNAYEDMDQTTLTYVYTQGIDGRFVCLGQSIGYGVSLGTQFTASQYPQYIQMPGDVNNVVENIDQPEPNGLYSPSSGEATIVNLIDSTTGKARTAIVEPRIITTPNRLPTSAVSVPCPSDIDPSKVIDVKESSHVQQR